MTEESQSPNSRLNGSYDTFPCHKQPRFRNWYNRGMGMRPANGGLTIKEKKFVRKLAENGGNATQAVMDSYNVKKKFTANQMAQALKKRPAIHNELIKIMDALGLDEQGIMEKWNEAIKVGWGERATHKDALSSLTMATRLRGMLYKDSAHLKVTLEQTAHKMPYEKLLEEYERLKHITDKVVIEGQFVYDKV